MKKLQKHMLILRKTSKTCFAPLSIEKSFFANFEQRNLRPDEDPSLFLWALKDILSKADPDLTDAAREILLSRQFMKGLPSQLRLKLLENNPTPTLKEMAEFVQRFRAVYRPNESSSFAEGINCAVNCHGCCPC